MIRTVSNVLAVAFGVACSPTPVQSPAAPLVNVVQTAPGEPECPRALALDSKAISEESVCLLRRYLAIDTTNPPGNEIAAARFLHGVLAREGIDAQIIESAPGRANLIARLRGGGRGKALMLVHHMDVVPATASEWTVLPLAGTIRDGQLFGRGSIDNKGAGVAELMTVLLLKRLGAALGRDVIVLAVADEESGGGYGARWLTEKRPDLFTDVEFVLNEGGAILKLGPGPVVYSVELAQKAPLWLRVTAHGAAGHASSPKPNSAATVLIRALARLTDYRFPILVLPEVQALFAARAATKSEPERTRLGNLAASLEDPAFREAFLAQPENAALVHNTLAITMLTGSAKENVVSERASAVLDLRLLPGQDAELVTRELVRVMSEPSLQVEPILSWRAYTSPRATALFAAIERLAKERDPDAVVAANVIGAFTDCNAFRAKNITCYGFLPLRVALADLEGVHGIDERIRIDSLSDAVIGLHTLVRHIAE